MKRLKKRKLKRMRPKSKDLIREEIIKHIISYNSCWSNKFESTLRQWDDIRLINNCHPTEREYFASKLNIVL